MALVLADRVQQTGTANTTVSFTLSGAVTGFQSFSVVGNGNTTYYSATDFSGNWEVGIGTYATGGTLTRTTIIASSNLGSAVTFSGTVNVFVTYPAEYATWASNNPGTSGNVLKSNGTGVAPSWGEAAGTITTTDFTATASQTTFTVSYVVGLVEVYQNGAKLGIADYTAINGTTIVLATGATAGDLIEVVAFSSLALSTAVSSFSAGTTGLTPNIATSGAITLAGTLVAANGGTGQSSYAVGDLVYASTTTALSKLADVATGNALISGGVGVAPSYGKIGLTTHVSGVLPAANGGTGQSTALIPSGTVMMFGQTAAPTGFTKLITNDNAALRVVSGTASTGGTVGFTTAFASQTPAGSVSTSISAISGTVGTSGSTTATGSVSTVTGTISGTVGSTTITTTTMPNHTHGQASVVANTSGGNVNFGGSGIIDNYVGQQTQGAGGDGAHNHSFSGSFSGGTPTFTGTAHTHTGGTFTFGSGTASSSFTGTAINLAVKYVDVIMATKD